MGNKNQRQLSLGNYLNKIKMQIQPSYRIDKYIAMNKTLHNKRLLPILRFNKQRKIRMKALIGNSSCKMKRFYKIWIS